MISPAKIPIPANWQDFEALIKKLFGEIWKYPEIKKNGRPGQAQQGVDVCGIPAGESSYFGIQCKNCSSYNGGKLTKENILSEIEKARNFNPSLKKLYIVSSFSKDCKIEEFVRKQNIEHIKLGYFEIHLYCWEDLVDLIEDNRSTYNWYIRNMNYTNKNDVEVVFDCGETDITIDIPIKRVIKKLRELPKNKILVANYKPINPFDKFYSWNKPSILDHIGNLGRYNISDEEVKRREDEHKKEIELCPQPFHYYLQSSIHNRSVFVFSLNVVNVGNATISNPRLLLEVDGDFVAVSKVNKGTGFYQFNLDYDYNVYFSRNKGEVIFNNPLVPMEQFETDDICIKPLKCDGTVLIKWRLLSDFFHKEGELIIRFKMTYKDEIVYVESEEEILDVQLHYLREYV